MVRLFAHFVLRDQVYAHFSRLSFEAPGVKVGEAVRYGATGSALIASSILITCIVGAVKAAQSELKQEWLMNLRDTCGEEFETDENGLLLANENGMYKGTVQYYFSNAGLLGLYIG